jgi:hypothetical protein
MLRKGVSGVGAAEAAEAAGEWAGDLAAAVRVDVPPDAPEACAKGCAHCCHLKVIVTAPEAIRLAGALRAGLDVAALGRLRQRVEATDARTHGMTAQQRLAARVPCPVLEDGLCLAHDARPLPCRGANSYDVDVCAAGLEGRAGAPPLRFWAPQTQIAEALRAGISNAAGANGLDGTLFELTAALRVLLARPKAGDEWGQGRRDALVSARDEEFAKIVRAQARPAPAPPRRR